MTYRLVMLSCYAVMTGERRIDGTPREALAAARQLVRDGAAFRVDVYRVDKPGSYGTWQGMMDDGGFVPPHNRKAWGWRR